MKRLGLFGGVALLAVALLAACAPEPEITVEVAPVEQSGDASASAEDGPPNRGSQLYATNPDTVVLGSGEPQLVELFAFW